MHRHLALLAAALAAAACSLSVKGQPLPEHVLAARPADFNVVENTVVLHYYGAGGWGIKWRDTYLLTAPYFTNHSIPALLAAQATARGPGPHVRIVPDAKLVKEGFAGTPVGDTKLLLIGHGHIDHAGDVPAFFADGLITQKPVLMADRSTTNELAAISDKFSCIAPIDYGDDAEASARCPVAGVRVTPIHSAHAPHLKLAGLEVAAYGGTINEPRKDLPWTAEDYKLGNTWAFLIDLLDASGNVAFRIHYVDAASSPPHAIVPKRLLKERAVDVHIGCVAGFDLAEDYPGAVIEHHDVRYVLGGHWEDFFQPRTDKLTPVRQVLDASRVEAFVKAVEAVLPADRGVHPLNKSDAACAERPCGPHGPTWSLPAPGETFHFAAGPQAPAPAPAATTTAAAP